jgi:hypothetical protein
MESPGLVHHLLQSSSTPIMQYAVLEVRESIQAAQEKGLGRRLV